MPAAEAATELRLATPPAPSLDWAVRAAGGVGLVSVAALRGGVSHANHRLRIRPSSGGTVDVVLRRAVRTDWMDEDPEYSPAQEIATYTLLGSSAIPAPRLVAADPEPERCDVSAILLTLAPGRRVVRPWDVREFVRELAEALPAVHSVDPAAAARVVPPYRPFYEQTRLAVPEWSSRPAMWRRAIALFDAQPPSEGHFIHRDYHPGNTLWSGRSLSAIVDWTLASFGPPSFDVGHMRANLALGYSLEVADAFLAAHTAAAGAGPYDPWWDIRAVLDWLPELHPTSTPAARLRRMEALVARAIASVA